VSLNLLTPSSLVTLLLRLRFEEPRTKNSRAPSYFSHFFERQLSQNGDSSNGVKTLYIDRDPVTFKDISMHLQGE
jgi:hypothetical protein